MKKIIGLLVICFLTSSCSICNKSTNTGRACTYTIFHDRVEIVYKDNNEHVIIPFIEGKSFSYSIRKYNRGKRRQMNGKH